MKWIARLSALVLATLLVTTGAYAQTSVGTVEGTVKDEQGAILPGATVTLTGPRGATTMTTDATTVRGVNGSLRTTTPSPTATIGLM